MHARGAVGCIAQGCAQGGGCARRPDGPTRARTRVARDGFESASTHEAVELPAGVAALHTALAKVDRDHFAHGCCRRVFENESNVCGAAEAFGTFWRFGTSLFFWKGFTSTVGKSRCCRPKEMPDS